MKVALVSAPVRNRNVDFNVRSIIGSMETLRGKADVVVFGEAALQGFDCLCWDFAADRHMAVAITDEPVSQIREAAKRCGAAVSFGFIERDGETLYSSQLFIGADGEIVDVFRRVSIGWKDYTQTDGHYREGECFRSFCYSGKTFAVGLCGDLWTDGRPEQMKALGTDVVLWPVWCDYNADEWNTTIKEEYARQAVACGERVALVNPYCADESQDDLAAGGAAYFRNGRIAAELPAGSSGILIAEL